MFDFFDRAIGFCVIDARTNRQTTFSFIYIDVHTLNLVQIFLKSIPYYESQPFKAFLFLFKFLSEQNCRNLLPGEIVKFHYVHKLA